ncbi:MAG: hypothetical protein WC897_00760 [Candidatus Gracilibacteria bacterium]
MQKKKLIIIAVSVIILLIPFIFVLAKWHQEKTIETEIQYVKDEIASDRFAEYHIKYLRTQEAKDFAETALSAYEEMKEAYPEPIITIINAYEMKEAERSARDENFAPITEHFTQNVIETGNGDAEFTLQFTVDPNEDAENSSPCEVFVSRLSAKEEVTEIDDEGIYSYTFTLSTLENELELIAKNKYKQTTFDMLIVREENQEERERRLASEEATREAERVVREWEQSEAGQICSRHPDWTDTECTQVADGRIWIGMAYEMIVEQIGNPNSSTPSNYGYGTEWQWCWWYRTPSCFYDDDNDGLIDSYN